MENLGMRVRIQFSANSLFERTVTFHNVTEIHYNYPRSGNQRVAFESDIHGTGFTYDITSIEEFEAVIETTLADYMVGTTQGDDLPF